MVSGALSKNKGTMFKSVGRGVYTTMGLFGPVDPFTDRFIRSAVHARPCVIRRTAAHVVRDPLGSAPGIRRRTRSLDAR